MHRRLAAALALCALAPCAFADTKSTGDTQPIAPHSDLPDIVARQWATDSVDLHNLQGNVVLLIFWQKPTGG